ncbi:MAG: hypothetical protein HQ500_05270 [Flavobacteriales bacterium]|nr:hypothetical protein [Flavobacteriales bacterium]
MHRIDEDDNATKATDRKMGDGRGKRFLAVLLIVAGSYWLLNRLGVLNFPHWLFQWPVILLVIGIVNLVVNRFQSIGGYVLILIGAYFYIDRNFDIPFDVAYYFWPVVLIGAGVIILVRPSRQERFSRWHREANNDRSTMMDSKEVSDSSDFMEETVILGGIKKDFTSQAFQGGRLRCVMGGAEIYLGDCKLSDNAIIQVTGFMSGVSIVIPKEWNVKVSASSLMGGISDERRSGPNNPTTAPTLTITGSVFMAGLEIKST